MGNQFGRWAARLAIALIVSTFLPSCAKLFGQGKKIEIVAPKSEGGGANAPQPPPSQGGGGFNRPSPGPGNPGGPGWSGPGWGKPGNGAGPGQGGKPGEGFDPTQPAPGLGRDGELTQDEYFDPGLGVKFLCLAQRCFIRRYVEKEASGEVIRFGLKAFSSVGLASNQPFFFFERTLRWQDQPIGQVDFDSLPAKARTIFPDAFGQEVQEGKTINGATGVYTKYQRGSVHHESFFLNDSQDGLAHFGFSFPPGQTDDAYLAYFILFSVKVDLAAPSLDELAFESATFSAGELATLRMKAADDLTGVDLKWLYQENPERLLADLVPRHFKAWIGYDGPHNREYYSAAYFFPLLNRPGISEWKPKPQSDSEFEYSFPLSPRSSSGRLLLGGLRVRDLYGHETRISLENIEGDAYETSYRLEAGSAQPTVLQRPAEFTLVGASVPDINNPVLTAAAFSQKEIYSPDQQQCLDLTYQDEHLVRRIGLEFSLDGKTAFSPTGGCLAETHASLSGNKGNLQVCYEMAPCFDADGKTLLPVNRPISLLKIVLFDEVGNRSELPAGPGFRSPEFFAR